MNIIFVSHDYFLPCYILFRGLHIAHIVCSTCTSS